MSLNVVHTDVMVSVPTTAIISEGNGMVEVCAILSAMEATERDFTVTLATNNDTGLPAN